MKTRRPHLSFLEFVVVRACVAVVVLIALGVRRFLLGSWRAPQIDEIPGAFKASKSSSGLREGYGPRIAIVDASGYMALTAMIPRWKPDSSLEEISNHWGGAAARAILDVDLRWPIPRCRTKHVWHIRSQERAC